MSIGALLDECRGAMGKGEFAQRLGISRRMLSALYSGERQPGRGVLSRLIREFPDKADQVVFLLSDKHDSAVEGTMVLCPAPAVLIHDSEGNGPAEYEVVE